MKLGREEASRDRNPGQMSTYDLADKVVLITGGTGGLGRATAQGLLARGAHVAIVDVHPRTPDLAADLSQTRAFGVTADVSERSAMDAAAAAAVARFGRIDVAIANAGVMGAASTLRTMPAASAEQVLTVNVNGVLNTVGATVEHVIAHQGQIVLVSSVFAFMNGMGAIPYAMSKAAVEQLGRGLRIELAEHGVSVLTAYFSLIQTDMIRKGVDADPRVLEILAALPRPLHKRLEPSAAADAIVRGLARRSPRVIRPRRWTALSMARGVIGPATDARLLRDSATLASLTKLDVADRSLITLSKEPSHDLPA
jgi:NAD(P)-dependent dehydrogenase (short-subunit alcohol dehydrogenase family)